MFFCPNCNNSLSITQQDQSNNLGIKNNQDNISETPNTVSSSSQESINNKIKNVPKLSTISNKAYFKCSNCGYVQEMEPGTLILSRAPEKATAEFIITDKNKYKDMIHDMTLPHTRNYMCPNQDCKSHKNHNLREAVWFKPNKYSFNIVYVCKACQTVW